MDLLQSFPLRHRDRHHRSHHTKHTTTQQVAGVGDFIVGRTPGSLVPLPAQETHARGYPAGHSRTHKKEQCPTSVKRSECCGNIANRIANTTSHTTPTMDKRSPDEAYLITNRSDANCSINCLRRKQGWKPRGTNHRTIPNSHVRDLFLAIHNQDNDITFVK